MLAASLAFTCVMAQSDSNEGKKKMPRMDRTEMMVKEFGLTDEQATLVKALNEKYPNLWGPGGRRPGKRGMNSNQTDGNTGASAQASERPERPSKEEMEKKMAERKQQQEAYDNELKGILTADQFAAYQKKQAEMKKNRPERPKDKE